MRHCETQDLKPRMGRLKEIEKSRPEWKFWNMRSDKSKTSADQCYKALLNNLRT